MHTTRQAVVRKRDEFETDDDVQIIQPPLKKEKLLSPEEEMEQFRNEVIQLYVSLTKENQLHQITSRQTMRFGKTMLDFLLNDITLEELYKTNFQDPELKFSHYLTNFLTEFSNEAFLLFYFVEIPKKLSKNALRLYSERMHQLYLAISSYLDKKFPAPSILHHSMTRAILFDECDAFRTAMAELKQIHLLGCLTEADSYPIHIPSEYNFGPCSLAVKLNRLMIIQAMIDNGCMLPVALTYFACEEQHQALFEFLFEFPIETRLQEINISRLLNKACESLNHTALDYLAKRGLEIHENLSNQLLTQAATDNNLSFIKRISSFLQEQDPSLLKNLALIALQHGNRKLCTYLVNIGHLDAHFVVSHFLNSHALDKNDQVTMMLELECFLANPNSFQHSPAIDLSNIENIVSSDLRTILDTAKTFKLYALIKTILVTFPESINNHLIYFLYGSSDDVEIIKLFLTLNISKEHLEITFDIAASRNHLDAVILLTQYVSEPENKRAFLSALEKGHIKTASYLYEHSASKSELLSIEEQHYHLFSAIRQLHSDDLIRFLISIRSDFTGEDIKIYLLDLIDNDDTPNFISFFESIKEKFESLGKTWPTLSLLPDAIRKRSLGITDYLLYKGEKIEKTDWDLAAQIKKEGDDRFLSLLNKYTPFPLLDIPEELLICVFRFLDFPELMRLSFVCQQLKVTSRTDFLLKPFFFHPNKERKLGDNPTKKIIKFIKQDLRDTVIKFSYPPIQKWASIKTQNHGTMIRTGNIFTDFLLNDMTIEKLHETNFYTETLYLDFSSFLKSLFDQFKQKDFINAYFRDIPQHLSAKNLVFYQKRMHDAHRFISYYKQEFDQASLANCLTDAFKCAVLFGENDIAIKTLGSDEASIRKPYHEYKVWKVVYFNRLEVAKHMIEAGHSFLFLSAQIKNDMGELLDLDVISFAAHLQHQALLNLLFEKFKNQVDISKILINAIKRYDVKAVHCLSKAGIDIQTEIKKIISIVEKNDYFFSLLIKAIEQGNLAFLKIIESLLIERSIDLKKLAFVAMSRRHPAICGYLLSLKPITVETLASHFYQVRDAENAENITIEINEETIVLELECLLTNRANIRDSSNIKPEMIEDFLSPKLKFWIEKASQHLCYELFDFLLAIYKNKKQMNDKCDWLHIAASEGNIEKMKILINHDICINDTDLRGETPLSCAILHNQLAAVDFLVKSNANLKSPTSPVKLALRFGHHEIAEYLYHHLVKEKEIPLSPEDKNKYLSIAIKNYHWGNIRFLSGIIEISNWKIDIDNILIPFIQTSHGSPEFITLFEIFRKKGLEPGFPMLTAAMTHQNLNIFHYLLYRGETPQQADCILAKELESNLGASKNGDYYYLLEKYYQITEENLIAEKPPEEPKNNSRFRCSIS